MLHFSRFKISLILGILFVGLWLALPNVMPQSWLDRMPSWLPHKSMVLGLDLQGGGHFLLAIDKDQVLRDQVTTLRDRARQTLADNKIPNQGGINGRTVTLTLRNPADQQRAATALNSLTLSDTPDIFGIADRVATVATSGDNRITLTLTDFGVKQRLSSIMSRAIEIVRRRIDGTGTTEPSIQLQGTDRILLQIPGLKQSSEEIVKLVNSQAKLEFKLVDQSMTAQQAEQQGAPIDSQLLPNADGPGYTLVKNQSIVSGEDLTDAQSTFNQQDHQWVVSIRFNTAGARAFGRVTSENVGRPFAMILDGKVLSAPNINEPIMGGSAQISGSFNADSAATLALQLRSGALPAPMQLVEERTVGPGLGEDSIRAGEMAAIVGSILVAVFMIAVYGLFGIIATVAVALNVGLIFGILSLLGATLTLPGIAGIVLTVGIAVDSNVLIYERIREEVRAGRSAITALDAGFNRALATIVDSNITTFIAAVVLFFVGTGAVKGFAITFGIGIITTLFTAFTVTRLLVAWWYRSYKPKTIPI